MVDFQKIQYFMKVAQTLNFTSAAKELYISPQALNKQIINLEAELGGRLFLRTTRKVELTEFGKVVQEQFARALKQYEKACQAVDNYRKNKERTLRIAFFQAISKKEVLHPLVQYLQAYDKELNVELIGGEIDEVNDWLQNDKADLLITNIHEYERFPGMETVTFMTAPAQIIVSLYHPWVVKETITVADMAQYPVLLLQRSKALEENSFYRHVCTNGRHFAPNFSSLLANLENGSHFAVFPQMFESMRWDGFKYLDLPKEYAFRFSMVAMYPESTRFKGLFSVLPVIAQEQMIPVK